MDATHPFETQDLQIADLVEREGRALVFVLAKWDLVEDPAATPEGLHRTRRADAAAAARRAGGGPVGRDRPGPRPADAGGDQGARRLVDQDQDPRPQRLAEDGGRAPSAAGGRRPPRQAEIHGPDQGAAADLRAVRQPRRQAAGQLPALSDQLDPPELRPARHADPHHRQVGHAIPTPRSIADPVKAFQARRRTARTATKSTRTRPSVGADRGRRAPASSTISGPISDGSGGCRGLRPGKASARIRVRIGPGSSRTARTACRPSRRPSSAPAPPARPWSRRRRPRRRVGRAPPARGQEDRPRRRRWLQQRLQRADQAVGAGEVGGHDLVPDSRRDVADRPQAAQHGGGVDQDVELAVALEDRAAQLVDAVAVGEVHRDQGRRARRRRARIASSSSSSAPWVRPTAITCAPAAARASAAARPMPRVAPVTRAMRPSERLKRRSSGEPRQASTRNDSCRSTSSLRPWAISRSSRRVG